MFRLFPLMTGLVFLGLLGCSHTEEAKKDVGPPPVSVALPIKKSIIDYRPVTGETVAKDSVEIRSRVSGYLKEVFFKEGDEVKKDQKLFEIDRRPYQANRDQAAANVVRAKAAAQAAKYELDRQEELLRKNATSKSEYDQAVGKYGVSSASVKSDEAALEVADVNLGYTEVLSPIEGKVGKFDITVGNLVTADVTKLTSIFSMDPMYVDFKVDENTMLTVKRAIQAGKLKSAAEAKMLVEMQLADEKGYPWKGYVNYVSNTVDEATRTLEIRAVFDNPNRLLLPRMFVRVRVALGPAHEAILISDRALGTEQGQKYVLVVATKDNKEIVEYRPVKIGTIEDGMRVVLEGLSDTDKVIVNGLQRVRPGMEVKAVVGPMPVERDRQPREEAKPAEAKEKGK